MFIPDGVLPLACGFHKHHGWSHCYSNALHIGIRLTTSTVCQYQHGKQLHYCKFEIDLNCEIVFFFVLFFCFFSVPLCNCTLSMIGFWFWALFLGGILLLNSRAIVIDFFQRLFAFFSFAENKNRACSFQSPCSV